MTIEMHTPQDRIPAGVINQIRNNVLELYHLDPNISRAEVFFHESSTFTGSEPRCTIRTTSLFPEAVKIIPRPARRF